MDDKLGKPQLTASRCDGASGDKGYANCGIGRPPLPSPFGTK
jgi:hypothetical protein